MNYELLLMYVVVAFFYVISPGPAIFLAIYNGAMHGVKVVMVSALGNILGLLLLSSLAMSGLSAILMTSATLFLVVKVVGASYLIYLGVRQLLASRKAMTLQQDVGSVPARSLTASFKEGFVVAATNPKPILFFTALFPQFLDVTNAVLPQFFVMTAIFMFFSFLSLTSYGYLAQRAKGLLAGGRGAWFQRISGGLFIGMGASLFQLKATQ